MSGEEKIDYVQSKQNINKRSSIQGASHAVTHKCERCGKTHGENDC